MSSTLLSIIIPVYNVEKYIRACLESVYNQNVEISNFEVIIVNDGTQDNSMLIVGEFAQRYDNIKIVNQENKGLSVARNNGMAVASGVYVWFVDSDDTIVPNCINYLFDIVKTMPDVDAFISQLLIVSERTGTEHIEEIGQITGCWYQGKEYLSKKKALYGTTQRYVFKKRFLTENGLFFMPGIVHEDGEFGIRMLYCATNVYILKKPIYKYLLRTTGSIMSAWKRKNSDDLILIYKELDKFFNNFVEKKDRKMFKVVIYRILLHSIEFAKEKWETPVFKEFYSANKIYVKRESWKMLRFSCVDLKTMFTAICCTISPLLCCKLKNKKFRMTSLRN